MTSWDAAIRTAPGTLLCGTVELFLEELGTVRREPGLDQVHILAQSWGGMLAMEYALTRPSGIVSLILADSPASMDPVGFGGEPSPERTAA